MSMDCGDVESSFAARSTRSRYYYHAPLEDPTVCIRLLEISNGEPEDQIQLKIRTWRRADAPPYGTLSYTWGDDKKTYDITINDAHFKVTKNCWLALTRLPQHTRNPTLLWVDAICIDQTDNHERSAQVNIMGEIYRGSVAFVSLGEHSSASEHLFETLFSLPPLAYGEFQSTLNDHDDDSLSSLYQGLREIVLGMYWQRVWTMQEFALCREIYLLGDTRCLTWTTFFRHFKCMVRPSLEIMSRLPGFDFEIILQTRFLPNMALLREVVSTTTTGNLPESQPAQGRSADLGNVILQARNRLCSDPRDKIFGVLSLVIWHTGQRPLQANYDWSPIRLATEAFIRMAENRSRPDTFQTVLEILQLVAPHDKSWDILAAPQLPQSLRDFPRMFLSCNTPSHHSLRNGLLASEDTLSVQGSVHHCRVDALDQWILGYKSSDYLLEISAHIMLHLRRLRDSRYLVINILRDHRLVRQDTRRAEDMTLTMACSSGTLATLFHQDLHPPTGSPLRLYKIGDNKDPTRVVFDIGLPVALRQYAAVKSAGERYSPETIREIKAHMETSRVTFR